MSYPVARYQIPDADNRGLQACVWQDALSNYNPGDLNQGHLFIDDFDKVVNNTTDASAANGWFIQDMAAGGTSESLIAKEGYGGLATLSAGTGTAHFGIEMQKASAATTGGYIELPTSSTDAKGIVCVEVRLTIDVSELQYVGLTESIANFLSATSALPTDSDYVGFYKTAAGDLTFVCANDNAGGTAVTDSYTVISAADLVDGATYRLGFRIDQDSKVHIGVNDTYYSPAVNGISSLALPIEIQTVRIALGRGGGSDTTVGSDIDYVATYVGPDANG